MRTTVVALALWAFSPLAGCSAVPPPVAIPRQPSADERARRQIEQLAAAERRVLDLLAASDPRLAGRLGITASDDVIRAIGTRAILAEDGATALRGASLDLFSFHARARTLDTAAADLVNTVGATALPETAPTGATPTRPRLERELLARLIAEERLRVADEEPLTDGASALVRAMVATWQPGASAWQWHEQDEWAARRLLEIRAALKGGGPRAAQSDLEAALYDLENVLVPMQYPRAVSALTEVHAALDADERPDLPAATPARLAALLKAFFGTTDALETIARSLEAARAPLAAQLSPALAAMTRESRDAVNTAARAMLFEDAACPGPADSPVRAATPPDERSGICVALRQFERSTQSDARLAALIALHDELVIALWTIAPPSPRTPIATLSFRVDEDLADKLKHLAASRPLIPLGAGLAARDLILAGERGPRLAQAWIAFGDAPLDIAERELSPARASGLGKP